MAAPRLVGCSCPRARADKFGSARAAVKPHCFRGMRREHRKNRTRIGPHLAQPWQPKGQRFQPSKSAMSGGLNLSESPSTLRSKQVERSADHRSVARTVRAKSEAGLPAAQDQRAHFDRESKTAPRRGLRWFVTARLSVL